MRLIGRGRGAAAASAETSRAASVETFRDGGEFGFTQAVIEQRWDDAESLFSEASVLDQAHLISAASEIVAPASFYDDFVQMENETGLAQLVRGSNTLATAWETRASATGDAYVNDFYLALERAEDDFRFAVRSMPENPIPWQQLLTSGRGLRLGRAEMDDRYVNYVKRGAQLSGHIAFQRVITEQWAGSHEEMWEHAEWMTRSAAPGSPNPALVATALIEHHVAGHARRHTIHELPDQLDKRSLIDEAMTKSYLDPSFDSSTMEGAAALSIWFTLHYLFGNWSAAAEIVPMIGDRFASFPMSYFQNASWEELKTFVHSRVARAA